MFSGLSEKLGHRVGTGGKDLADQMNEYGPEADDDKLLELLGQGGSSSLESLIGGRGREDFRPRSQENEIASAINNAIRKLQNGIFDLKPEYQAFILAHAMKNLSGAGKGAKIIFKGDVELRIVRDSKEVVLYDVVVNGTKRQQFSVLTALASEKEGGAYLTRIALAMRNFIDP